MKTLRSRVRKSGFTLIEILIAVAIVGILVGLAVPNFLKASARAKMQTCIENLSQIESAKQIWGVENAKKDGDVPTTADLVGPMQYIKKTPECPAAGSYTLNAIGTNAVCTVSGHIL